MRIASTSILLSILLAGCGTTGTDDGSDEVPGAAASGKADYLSQLPPPAAQHIYWNIFNGVNLDDANPLGDRVFTARGGQAFTLTASAIGDPDNDDHPIDTTKGVGFKLYRLARHTSGALYWKLLKSVDGAQGQASLTYGSSYSRLYLVEAGVSATPAFLNLQLSCSSSDYGDCAFGIPTGAQCGAGATLGCDDGLYCQYTVGSCGGAGASGTCVSAPDSCPRLGAACIPVCGCDGTTYCQGCDIASHQAQPLHGGACDCDPTVYSAGVASLTTTYQYVDAATNDHFSYTFKGKTGASSLYQPGCLFATPFHCEIAVAPKNGTYSVDPTHVTISYDDGTSATFTTEVNCQGQGRLTGSDYGRTLVLTPSTN